MSVASSCLFRRQWCEGVSGGRSDLASERHNSERRRSIREDRRVVGRSWRSERIRTLSGNRRSLFRRCTMDGLSAAWSACDAGACWLPAGWGCPCASCRARTPSPSSPRCRDRRGSAGSRDRRRARDSGTASTRTAPRRSTVNATSMFSWTLADRGRSHVRGLRGDWVRTPVTQAAGNVDRSTWLIRVDSKWKRSLTPSSRADSLSGEESIATSCRGKSGN